MSCVPSKRSAPSSRKRRVVAGVSDHAGWAVVVCADDAGAFVDRRRIDLVDEGVPVMPHHHDGQKLPIDEAVALVERVQASAAQVSALRLDELANSVDGIVGIALRECPPLPDTIAERITNYRAMCVADWVMYRQALAAAAVARGWSVSWYSTADVATQAAQALGVATIDTLLNDVKAAVGPPWQKDHRLAMAAAIAHAAKNG